MADISTKDTFIMYVSYYESIRHLTLEQKGMLLDGIFLYAKGETSEINDPVVTMALSFIKERMSSNAVKYAAIVEKRREAGRKHKGNQYSKNLEQMEQMEQVFQNGTDNGNVNVNDSDNDNEPTNMVGDIKKKTSNEVKKKKSPVTRFVPPTVEEVRVYCLERGDGIDAQHFVDYYTARGWKYGNTAIKDWKACVRIWEQRNGFDQKHKPQPQVKLGVGEYINKDGNRCFGTGKLVPHDAPPRPSNDVVWSRETNSWIPAGI